MEKRPLVTFAKTKIRYSLEFSRNDRSPKLNENNGTVPFPWGALFPCHAEFCWRCRCVIIINEKVNFISIVHLFLLLKEFCNKIVQFKRGFSFVFVCPLLFFLFLVESLLKSCVYIKLLFEFPVNMKWINSTSRLHSCTITFKLLQRLQI